MLQHLIGRATDQIRSCRQPARALATASTGTWRDIGWHQQDMAPGRQRVVDRPSFNAAATPQVHPPFLAGQEAAWATPGGGGADC